MQCNKANCKQQFHVTCAQSLGLLCEEAGNYLDNVKYCGYCQHHYSKLVRMWGFNWFLLLFTHALSHITDNFGTKSQDIINANIIANWKKKKWQVPLVKENQYLCYKRFLPIRNYSAYSENKNNKSNSLEFQVLDAQSLSVGCLLPLPKHIFLLFLLDFLSVYVCVRVCVCRFALLDHFDRAHFYVVFALKLVFVVVFFLFILIFVFCCCLGLNFHPVSECDDVLKWLRLVILN